MFVFSQNTYAEVLTPKVMVLEGGVWGGDLGNEDRALSNGISFLLKEASDSSLTLSVIEVSS